jgi:hypothetical protein
MGPRFRKQAGEMFARIVREYPLSARVKDATKRLQDMEIAVPAPDQAALDRAKWEQENAKRVSMVRKTMGLVKGGPDLSHSARSGQPTMTDPKKTMPASIPVVNNAPAEAAANGTPGAPTTTDITATTTTGTALEGKTSDAAAQPLPTNRDKELEQMRAKQKKLQDKAAKKKKKTPDQAAPAATTATPAAAAPPATTTPQS